MAQFRLFLIGKAAPMDVEIPARDVHDICELASTSRFITGNLTTPDESGVLQAFLVPSCRIQCVVEI